MANASSFMRTVLMPMARAAISSSRIASHARPYARILQAQVHDDDHDEHGEQK